MRVTARLTHLKPLHGFLLRNPNVRLFQGYGSEAVVKVKETLGRVDTQECGHIFVVWKCGGKANKSYWILRRLDLTDGSGNNGFQHWTPTVMEQMDLVLRREKEI